MKKTAEMTAAVETTELDLSTSVTEMTASVAGLDVYDDASYKVAASACKAVKALQKEVKSFWEPLRAAAKKQYDAVLARKKEMLAPLDSAEADLKGKMGAYQMEQERRRQEAERALRETARMEMERRLAEAAAAETAGNSEAAEYALADAEALEGLSMTGTVNSTAPAAKGVSVSRTWKVTAVDPARVPVSVAGYELRPVDMSAVMRLIRETGGQVKIPGIEFEEDVRLSVRS